MNWRRALVLPLIFALVIPSAVVPDALAQGLKRDPVPLNLSLQRDETPLPELGDISQATLTPQMERRIGEEAMREIRADPTYVDDPELEDYLNSIGQKLVAAGPGASQEFQFFLIHDDTINAFSMPGGFVGVNTGLLLAAQTESELAAVLGHEVSHVTQHHIARMMAQASTLSIVSIAGMILGLLAARNSGQAGTAAMAASQAGAVQAQLAYSRDYEREADRVGFDRMRDAGFDVTGMVTFFERLERATRIQENNAPAYLQNHPLTVERIADMENRAQHTPYKQYVDKPEFQLSRAKLRVDQGAPREVLAYFERQLKERRFASETATRYGLVSALMRTGDFRRADTELAALRAVGGPEAKSPMIDLLAMRLKSAAGDKQGALQLGLDSLSHHTNYRPLQYAVVRARQALGQHADAVAQLAELVRRYPRDMRLYTMQAESYAAMGRGLLSHQAQAEVYYLQGAYPAAVEQLSLAQKSGDGDFYQQSAVDARLREMRTRNIEDEKDQKRR